VNAMTRHMLAERFGLEVRSDTELVSATILQTIKPVSAFAGWRESLRP